MTYMHIQKLPVWLVIGDDIHCDWDTLVLEMLDDFIPEKFIRDAYAA